MRRLAALVVVLGSCSSGQGGRSAETPRQVQAREEATTAFKAWRDCTAAGEVERHYDMLSYSMISDWLFRRLQSGDRPAQEWRSSLTGRRVRTDLDLWLGFCERNAASSPSGRAALLPSEVLAEPSLRVLYRDYFMREIEKVKLYMDGLSSPVVAVDSTGVTVTVKNNQGNLEAYAMVHERGAWKVDGFRPEGGR